MFLDEALPPACVHSSSHTSCLVVIDIPTILLPSFRLLSRMQFSTWNIGAVNSHMFSLDLRLLMVLSAEWIWFLDADSDSERDFSGQPR